MPAMSTFGDLLTDTLAELGRNKVAQTQTYTSHPIYNNFFSGSSAVEDVSDGYQFQRRVRMRDPDGFMMGQLLEANPVVMTDTLELASEDWHYPEENSLAFDDREPVFNRGKSQIVDHLRNKMDGGWADWVKNLERQGAGQPASSSDVKNMKGLLFMAPTVTSGSTDSAGGFNGQRHYYSGYSSSTTTLFGIDSSLAKNANWRGWVATHNGTFDSTTRDQVRTAMENTTFETIPQIVLDNGRTARTMLLVNTSFILQYERDANLGPDDTNGDLARFNSRLKFRGVPLVKVQAWDTLDTINSVIGVNTKHCYGVKATGAWMNEGAPSKDRAIRNFENTHLWRIPMSGTGLTFCDNVRAGLFRIHSAF